MALPPGIEPYKEFLNWQTEKHHLFIYRRDFVGYFDFIDKRAGLHQYLKLFDIVPDDQKWDSFIAIYVRSEYGFDLLKNDYPKILKFAQLSEERSSRIAEMKKRFNEPVKIYHGENFTFPAYDHYSWTTQKSVAKFYAFRMGTVRFGNKKFLSKRL